MFGPANLPAMSFARGVPSATRARLQSLYASSMRDAHRGAEWQQVEDEARRQARDATLDAWTHKLMIEAGGARCATCKMACTFAWGAYETPEAYMRAKIAEAFERRPWAQGARTYVPSAAEEQFFVLAMMNLIFRRRSDGTGIFCGNRACTANKSIEFVRLDVQALAVPSVATATVHKRARIETTTTTTGAAATSSGIGNDDDDDDDDGFGGDGTSKRHRVDDDDDDENGINTANDDNDVTTGALVASASTSAVSVASSAADVTDADGAGASVSAGASLAASVTTTKTMARVFASKRVVPLTAAEEEALSFTDAPWIEIKQQAGRGFHVLFARWQPFVAQALEFIDSVPQRAAATGNAERVQAALRYRAQYMFDVSTDRLLTYAQVIERTESCMKAEGYKSYQIHQYAPFITAPFDNDVRQRLSRQSLMDVLDWTHSEWMKAVDADPDLKRAYEIAYDDADAAHRQRLRRRRAAALAAATRATTHVTGNNGGGGGAASAASAAAAAAATAAATTPMHMPTVAEARQQQVAHRKRMVRAYHMYEATKAISDWLCVGASDDVRCSPVVGAHWRNLPALVHTLPFLIFVHAYCDLVEAGVVEEARTYLLEPFAAMFAENWREEMATLRAIGTAKHIAEQCTFPRDFVGIARAAKPYVLTLTRDAITELDGFVKMHSIEHPFLRQTMAGTRLRLCLAV